MTVDDLVAEARHNRTGPPKADFLSPTNLGLCLRFVLCNLLEEVDYDVDPQSDAAMSARVLACLIAGADDMSGKAVLS